MEYEIDDVPAVGIAGSIRSTWCIGLAMILGRGAAHETAAADAMMMGLLEDVASVTLQLVGGLGGVLGELKTNYR